MKETKETYKKQSWVWDAELEILLALFINRLIILRPKLNKNKVSREILEKYIKKKKNSHVNATPLMNDLLKNKKEEYHGQL